jgi:hypothetical protein
LTRDEAISILCGKVQRFSLDLIRRRRTIRVPLASNGFRAHEDPGEIIFAVETYRDGEGIEHQSEDGFLYLSDVTSAECSIGKSLAATAGPGARRDEGGNSPP